MATVGVEGLNLITAMSVWTFQLFSVILGVEGRCTSRTNGTILYYGARRLSSWAGELRDGPHKSWQSASFVRQGGGRGLALRGKPIHFKTPAERTVYSL